MPRLPTGVGAAWGAAWLCATVCLATEHRFDWTPSSAVPATVDRDGEKSVVVDVRAATPDDSLLFEWQPSSNQNGEVFEVDVREFAAKRCPDGDRSTDQPSLDPKVALTAEEMIEHLDEVAQEAIEAEGRAEGWLQVDLEDRTQGSMDLYFMSAGPLCRRAKIMVSPAPPAAPCPALRPGAGWENSAHPTAATPGGEGQNRRTRLDRHPGDDTGSVAAPEPVSPADRLRWQVLLGGTAAAVAADADAAAADTEGHDTAAAAAQSLLAAAWMAAIAKSPELLHTHTVAGSSAPHPEAMFDEEGDTDCVSEDKSYPAPGPMKPVEAKLSYPWGCAYSRRHGWVLVGDNGCAADPHPNDRLMRVDSADGTTEVLAGGYQGYRDGVGAAVRFRHLAGIAVDERSDVAYLVDSGNHCIRKVDLATARVSTVAGMGVDTLHEDPGGYRDGVGVAARFRHPQGLVLDAAHGVLYVSDTDNHRIRAVALGSGAVSTLAGSAKFGKRDGPALGSRFKHPTQLALDREGRMLYIADHENHRIRYIALGTGAGRAGGLIVNTLVGLDRGMCDGSVAAARFDYPEGLAYDHHHRLLYVADFRNARVRAVAAVGHPAQGATTTVAGGGGGGGEHNNATVERSLVDGPVGLSRLYNPTRLALAEELGLLFVADQANHRVRAVRVPASNVFVAEVAGWDGPPAGAMLCAALALIVAAVLAYQFSGSASAADRKFK